MTGVQADELARFLGAHPPFDSLGPDALDAVAQGARIERFDDGEQILDAFVTLTDEVFVVVDGRVRLWTDADHVTEAADTVLGPGGVFGFSAMLTERSIGPRVVAAGTTTVARIPAALAGPAFTSHRGARFLTETMAATARRPAGIPSYSTIDELILRKPLVVEANTPVGEVARRMTEQDVPAAAVKVAAGRFGLVTDALLRSRVLVGGRPASTPAHLVMDMSPPSVGVGDSAVEALMLMLERDADFVLVTDRAGELCGVVAPRDFAVSPTTAGVSLQEQLRRATTVDDLAALAGRVPTMLDDLLSRGMASGRVIAVYSAVLDTIIRRAIGLVFHQHTELPVDSFTWLSLGSNGRREAVLSSDVDSAVAFDSAVPEAEIVRFRAAFGEIYGVLARAGLSGDDHGATAQHALFARTNAAWRAAGEQWLAAPAEQRGAIMTSLHGGRAADPRRPGAARRGPGLQRPAPAPGHDAPAADGVTRASGQAPLDLAGAAAGHPRHQGARAAAGGQPRPLGRVERRFDRPADHRPAAGRVRIGHAARRPGAHPGRGVRGGAGAAPALPAGAVPRR